jgi:hypothetical protein
MYKMDFDTMASNIILVIVQMKLNFEQILFFNTLMFVWIEKLVQMFFVKSHDSNFSIIIEMVQSIQMVQTRRATPH